MPPTPVVLKVFFFTGCIQSRCYCDEMRRATDALGRLATDAAGELDVLGVDGDTLGVDGAEVGVLEKRGKVGLGGFLQGHNGVALKAQVLGVEFPGDLPHKPLEGKLADEKLGRLLVLADLTESHDARTETVGLLDAMTFGGVAGIGLARGSASVLAGGLLDTRHCCAKRG